MIQIGDKEATILAYKNLGCAGRLEDVEEMTAYDVRDFHLRENIICIGGPYWNQVTRRFMREVKSPFIFDFSNPADDRTPLIDCLTGERFESAWSGRRLTRDFGFFARFKNTLNVGKYVVLVCGIETPAVMGMLLAFSEEQSDFLKLHEVIVRAGLGDDSRSGELPDFFVLMEFGVEHTGAVHLPAADDQIKRVICEWKTGHSLCLQEAPKI